MITWIYHWLGLGSANGAQYLFWSGIGGDIAELAIVFAIVRGLLKLRKQHIRHSDALHRHIDYKFNQLKEVQDESK